MKKENIVLSKSFDFACDVLDLNDRLIEKKHYQLARQVVNSGTSIGANVREAQRAVSKADFINKMGIALKEADETLYWFQLIDKKVFKLEKKLMQKVDELISLLVKIINSSKRNG